MIAILVSSTGTAETVRTLDGPSFLMYVGTYTRQTDSEGIYIFQFNSATGALTRVGLGKGVDNPSFIAIHPTHKYLYCVNEVNDFEGAKSGAVSAFSINAKDGSLDFLNQQPTGGGAPCHLVVDAAGKNVLVANYVGGSVASLPIGDDGRLGPMTSFVQHEGSSVNPRRQEAPHAHSINLDSDNQFAVAADLGLDKVLVYRFDSRQGKLTPNNPPSVSIKPGSGPRHFAFHPGGQFAYVINELALTVTAFEYDAKRGLLKEMQTISTVPDGVNRRGLSTAEVRVHPSGKFLFGSNRGHDTIVVYRIDEKSGKLTYVENEPTGGRTPRNFFVDPTGKYLLAENQSTGTIVVFEIDQSTGALTRTKNGAEVPNPVCIRMIPLGG